jgi:riboflavin synthase
MFTGLVEEVGTLKRKIPRPNGLALQVEAHRVLEGTKIGDSIAVDGICLTVTSMSSTGFTTDAVHDTIRSTALGTYRVGNPLQLEREMPADGRFGGRFVSGHIDGTARLISRRPDGEAMVYTFDVGSWQKYCIPKGSIAINGTSLTLQRVTSETISISLITHSRQVTTFDRLPLPATTTEDIIFFACHFAFKVGKRRSRQYRV